MSSPFPHGCEIASGQLPIDLQMILSVMVERCDMQTPDQSDYASHMFDVEIGRQRGGSEDLCADL